MKATDLTKSLTALVEQKVPTFLWGAPGIGKSSIVKQIADERKIGFIDLRLAHLETKFPLHLWVKMQVVPRVQCDSLCHKKESLLNQSDPSKLNEDL